MQARSEAASRSDFPVHYCPAGGLCSPRGRPQDFPVSEAPPATFQFQEAALSDFAVVDCLPADHFLDFPVSEAAAESFQCQAAGAVAQQNKATANTCGFTCTELCVLPHTRLSSLEQGAN